MIANDDAVSGLLDHAAPAFHALDAAALDVVEALRPKAWRPLPASFATVRPVETRSATVTIAAFGRAEPWSIAVAVAIPAIRSAEARPVAVAAAATIRAAIASAFASLQLAWLIRTCLLGTTPAAAVIITTPRLLLRHARGRWHGITLWWDCFALNRLTLTARIALRRTPEIAPRFLLLLWLHLLWHAGGRLLLLLRLHLLRRTTLLAAFLTSLFAALLTPLRRPIGAFALTLASLAIILIAVLTLGQGLRRGQSAREPYPACTCQGDGHRQRQQFRTLGMSRHGLGPLYAPTAQHEAVHAVGIRRNAAKVEKCRTHDCPAS